MDGSGHGPLQKSRDGRLFLVSQGMDAVSSGLAQVALPWLALDAGAGPGGAALVFATGLLPYLAFGLLAGVVADRTGRRRLLLAVHAAQALAATAIPLWAVSRGTPPLSVIFVAALVIGSGRVFADAAAFGAVAELAGTDHYTASQATLTAAWSVGLFVGPSVGGVLVATVGAPRAMAVEALALGTATVLVASIRSSLGGASGDSSSAASQAKEALRFVLTDPLVRIYTGVSLAWNLAATGALALQVPYLRRQLHLSAATTGTILAVASLTGLAVPFFLDRLIARVPPQTLLLLFMAGTPLGLVLLLQSTSALSAGAAVALLATLDWCTLSLLIGHRQEHAPAAMQSRVGITGRMVAMCSMALGTLLAGALADRMSLRATYWALAGVGSVAVLASIPPLLRLARSRQGGSRTDA